MVKVLGIELSCAVILSNPEVYHSLGALRRASLVAQLLKNLPAMQETPVQFLGWEGALERE